MCIQATSVHYSAGVAGNAAALLLVSKVNAKHFIATCEQSTENNWTHSRVLVERFCRLLLWGACSKLRFRDPESSRAMHGVHVSCWRVQWQEIFSLPALRSITAQGLSLSAANFAVNSQTPESRRHLSATISRDSLLISHRS